MALEICPLHESRGPRCLKHTNKQICSTQTDRALDAEVDLPRPQIYPIIVHVCPPQVVATQSDLEDRSVPGHIYLVK